MIFQRKHQLALKSLLMENISDYAELIKPVGTRDFAGYDKPVGTREFAGYDKPVGTVDFAA